MNFTYLVNKPQLDGTKKLEVVSRAEWQRIVAENAADPHAEKRYFIYDWIIDANEQDCMVIEVSKSQYKEWNQERMAASRNRTWGKKFAKISMNDECVDEEGEKIDLQEMLPGSEAPETAVFGERMDTGTAGKTECLARLGTGFPDLVPQRVRERKRPDDSAKIRHFSLGSPQKKKQI